MLVLYTISILNSSIDFLMYSLPLNIFIKCKYIVNIYLYISRYILKRICQNNNNNYNNYTLPDNKIVIIK